MVRRRITTKLYKRGVIIKEQDTKNIIFKTEDEKISIDAHFDEETVLLK